jgi:hypothetical protein
MGQWFAQPLGPINAKQGWFIHIGTSLSFAQVIFFLFFSLAYRHHALGLPHGLFFSKWF